MPVLQLWCGTMLPLLMIFSVLLLVLLWSFQCDQEEVGADLWKSLGMICYFCSWLRGGCWF